MFADTLIESSSSTRKRKRWPMATAFTLEIILAAIAIMVPLLSTGIIPLSAHPPIFAPPLNPIPLEQPKPIPDNHTTNHAAGPSKPAEVVLINNNRNAIPYGSRVNTNNPDEVRPGDPYISDKMPDGLMEHNNGPAVKPGPGQDYLSAFRGAAGQSR
ncbi:MAG TPA: hypothetical protein VE133_02570 [Candidatus Sulfotelmatobacter sp.]|nr:hypothetical protein [Candidatus Sulfotelmatobacter sp.]